jgi:hypothetical protein
MYFFAGFAYHGNTDLLACTESGNMLIMTYAHARAGGDGSLISRHVRMKLLSSTSGANKTGQYSLLKSWADYLSNYALYTTDECVFPSMILVADSLNDTDH